MSEIPPEYVLASMITDASLPYLVRYAAMHDLMMCWSVGTGDPAMINSTCDVGTRILKDGYHVPCVGHA